jgi:hypothetical protein
MVISRKTIIMRVVVACLSVTGVAKLAAQEPSDLQALFQQFQSPQTSDRATRQIIDLAKTNPNVKPYLAKHLPAVIEKRTASFEICWTNAARLAGELKIVETAPALAKYIGPADSGVSTMSERARLDGNPAVKALLQIGDPAIPALKEVLAQGSVIERNYTIATLKSIGSPAAKSALREHLKRETDPVLRERIQAALAR